MTRALSGFPEHKEIDALLKEHGAPDVNGNVWGAVNSGEKITRLYALTTVNEAKYEAFVTEHQKTCRQGRSPTGMVAWTSQFEFRFCDDSVTTTIEAACTKCGAKANLTDYSNV